MPLPIAVVCASPLERAGLGQGLEQHGGFELRLACASLAEARAAGFGGAEVAIVDPDADETGIGLVEDLHEAAGGPALVFLMAPGADAVEWLRAGVSVLPRDAPIAMIAAAAQAAVAGLAASTPGWWSMAASARESPEAAAIERLTPREHQVLAQMAFGLGNREIADALHISAHTAKFHVAQVIAKLDASSRTQAVAKALRAGLVVS